MLTHPRDKAESTLRELFRRSRDAVPLLSLVRASSRNQLPQFSLTLTPAPAPHGLSDEC